MNADSSWENRGWWIGLAVCCSFSIPSGGQTHRYVATGGVDGTNACTNPSMPCATFSHAIGQADPGDIIEAAPGIYTEAGIRLDRDVTLRGGGATLTILQAAARVGIATHRVLDVEPGVTAVIEQMTLRHGRPPLPTTSLHALPGGGILNQGNLTLTDCVVTRNRTRIGILGDPPGDGGDGAGLHSTGPLALIRTLVTGNQTGGGGPTFTHVAGAAGGNGGNGGGVYARGPLFLKDTVVTLNATGKGGLGTLGGHGGHGAGVYTSGISTGRAVLVASNTCGEGGDSPTDANPMEGIEYGNGGSGGGIYSTRKIELVGSRLSTNRAGDGGTAESSDGGHGGGLYGSGDIFLDRCLVDANQGGQAGILPNVVANGAMGGGGGGLYLAEGFASIQNSTLTGNRCGDGGSGFGFSLPGGGGSGGGILNRATTLILHCTIQGNHAGNQPQPAVSPSGLWGSGGGVWSTNRPPLVLDHTIVAGNSAPTNQFGPDAFGIFTSAGYNLIESEDDYLLLGDRTGLQVGVDPLLATLTDTGGLSSTHAPMPGSPAVDAGDPGFAAPPYTDQRGEPRVDGLGIDLGAHETFDPDDDDDGMPDDFELHYGFNSTNPADAAGNFDADPFTNQEEYIADTDPTNPASFFALVEVGAGQTNHVVWYGPSSTARVYRLQSTLDPAVGWADIPGQSDTAGSGLARDSLSDTNYPAGSTSYRVRVAVP